MLTQNSAATVSGNYPLRLYSGVPPGTLYSCDWFQVVANREDKKVCCIVILQGLKQRKVQIHSFDNSYVHIISGLEVDKEVLLSPSRLTDN